MARDRYQEGHVEETGKLTKKWKGHYFIYERQADGTEKRVHKAKIIGLRSKMKKSEAQKALREFIAQQTNQNEGKAVPAKELTLRWFFEQRYRPMNESHWKESSRKEMVGNIDRYVLRLIGDIPLAKLDKFTLQMQANNLALKFSKSVVEKYLVWTRAMLEEAVDQDLLAKNPARKLTMPNTREVNKRTVKPSEIRAVMQCMEGRVRIALLASFALGLRPGELLALRWDDVHEEFLRIDESARYGKLYPPKTKGSAAVVWMPGEMRAELEGMRSATSKPRDFVFPNAKGGPYRLDNFRKRILKPALAEAKEKAQAMGLPAEALKEITFQVCRRTCATLMQRHGNVKDIQAHLRHAQASTTADVYMQPIPESVQTAVHSLCKEIFDLGQGSGAIQ